MNADNDRYLRMPEVMHLTGLSRATIYRKIGEGTFPHRVQISTNCVAWHETDIVAWKAAPMQWSHAA
jgi:prophage regulatory protein